MMHGCFTVFIIFTLFVAAVWGVAVHNNRVVGAYTCGYSDALHKVRLPEPDWHLSQIYCDRFKREAQGHGYNMP